MGRDSIRRTYFRRIILVLCLALFCTGLGCSQKFTVVRPDPIEIEGPTHYNVKDELDRIPKPTKIKRLYGKVESGHLEFVDDPAEADFFILAPKEYAKVTQLKELALTYKAIIIKQEELVNVKNATIEELLRLAAILERERDVALTAWENSQNMYLQERRSHKIDNTINRVGMYVISIGSIVLLAVGL